MGEKGLEEVVKMLQGHRDFESRCALAQSSAEALLSNNQPKREKERAGTRRAVTCEDGSQFEK